MRKRILSIVLASIMVIGSVGMTGMRHVSAAGTVNAILDTDTSTPRSGNVFIEVSGTLKKQDIQAAVDRINEIRWEACTNGYAYPNDENKTQLSTKLTEADYVPITYSLGLEKLAIIRAAESSLSFEHERLNSVWTRSYTMPAINGTKIWLENLHADSGYNSNIVDAINNWYGEKNLYVTGGSGYGHYQLMINPKIKCFGMGLFCNPDACYETCVAGEFSHEFGSDDMHATFNYDGTYTQLVEIKTSYIDKIDIVGNSVYNVGGEEKFSANAETNFSNNYIAKINSGITWESSNTDAMTIDEVTGEAKAISAGETTITVKDINNTITESMDVLVLPAGITVTSIQQPSKITVDYNVKPTLPTSVGCLLSDGTTVQVSAKWDDYDVANLKTGTDSKEFSIRGYVLNEEVTQEVHVNPAKIRKIFNGDKEITVDSGIKPSYEYWISVSLENGWTYTTYPIKWDSNEYYNKTQGGDFRVKGIAYFDYDGERMPIDIYTNLHVNPAEITNVEFEQDNATIITPSGVEPSYPMATVSWTNHAKPTSESIEWANKDPEDSTDLNNVKRKYMMKDGGDYTLTGTYNGKTTSITVHVNPATATKAELKTADQSVTTPCGTAPSLPKKANVTWSNGDVTEETITWETLNSADYNVLAGRNDYVVSGTCQGKTVSTNVTVLPATVNSVDEIPAVNTVEGMDPTNKLPSQVTVNWSNNTSSKVNVTWETIQASNYASPGTFNVTGHFTDMEKNSVDVTCKVNVAEKSLKSIALKNGKLTKDISKYSYNKSDIKGTIVATYDNDFVEDIEITSNMISGLNTSSTSDSQTITISYSVNGVTKTLTTTAYLIKRTGIEISKEPNKLNYIEDEVDSLNIEGIEVKAKLHNGKTGADTYEVVSSGAYSISNFTGFNPKPSTYGNQTITLSLYGFTDTYNVNVAKKSVKAINITKKPTKLKYVEGQKFSVSGMVVTATYDNNKTENLPLADIFCRMNVVDGVSIGEEVNTNSVGTIKVTALYQDENNELEYFADDFEITVIKKEVDSIALTKLPSKTVFPQNDQSFDAYNFSDGEITATYNDGDKKVISLADTTLFEFDITKLGEQTVAVSYGGKRTSFKATVNEPKLVSTTYTQPTKTGYAEGEKLNLEGAKINFTYDNGITNSIPIEISNSDINVAFASGESISAPLTGSDKTLVISYKGTVLQREDGLPTTISLKKRTSISIASGLDNYSYPQGITFDKLDFTGLEVEVIFEDGSTSLIPTSEYEIVESSFDSSKIGMENISINAYGFTTEISVEIRAPRLTSVSVTPPTKLDYVAGQGVDISGLTASGTYDNGTSSTLSISASNLKTNVTDSKPFGDAFSTATAGTYSVYAVFVEDGDNGKVAVKSQPFTVNVHEKVAQSISIAEGPSVTTLPQGLVNYSKSSFGDGSLTVDYGYGLVETVAFSNAGVTVSGLNIDEVGAYTVTVSYGGKNTSFDAKVVEPTIDGTYVTAPAKTSYTKGEALDISGSNFVVKLSNGREESFALTSDEAMAELQTKYGYTVTAQFVDENGNPTDANSAGTKTLAVSSTKDGVTQNVAMPSGANVTVQVNNPVTPKPASNNTTNKTTTPAKNTSTSKTSTPKSTEPKYKNEWRNGKWYGADGNSTYSGTLSWKSNSKGWWVEDSAGWYPQNQWQKIDGIWYYFKPDGYMASSEYYNGYWFNSNGSWDPQYKLSWKSNATGWWVEDISGWWPSNKWLKVDGDWYYFNGSGYMATSQYVDGYWLAANGVCQ